MLWLLSTAVVLAQAPGAAAPPTRAPGTVVAVGDGPLAVPPAADAEDTVPGGWVAVLDDCLQERDPSRWSVVNQVVRGETARSARRRVGKAVEQHPQVVVLGVGARELVDRTVKVQAFKSDLGKLIRELGSGAEAPRVLLLGVVTHPVAGDPDGLARRAGTWNETLAQLASASEHVDFLDLQASWPDEGGSQASTTGAGGLTDQGHARIAAAVCDAVLALDRARPAPRP